MALYILIGVFVLGLASLFYMNYWENQKQDDYFLIGVSQPNVFEPWRIAMNEEIMKEVEKFTNIRIIFTDAAQSTGKQEKDLEKLMAYGIDLLIVSMNDSEVLTPTVSQIYKQIPVIVLDRDVIGYDYTLFIGLDNYQLGKNAGKFIVDHAGTDPFNVVEIMGSTYSQPVLERSLGFKEGIANSNIKVLTHIEANWEKDRAEDVFKAFIQKSGMHIDAVYAHSDDMAFGAYTAAQALGLQDITIIGMDGLSGEGRGLDLVKRGLLSCTFTCPTGGKAAIEYAVDILNHASGIPKKVILRTQEINQNNIEQYLTQIKNRTVKDNPITLGYAQVGSESSWRIANTESIQEAAKVAGINLIFKNVDNELLDEEKQKKQIAYINQFIDQKVDVIAFSPIVETGWDDVLKRAKEANIPVILSDRQVDSDSDLWDSYMGSDFVEEGRRAARWLLDHTIEQEGPIRIAELVGTKGSAPAKGRQEGFLEMMSSNPKYSIVYSVVGNFNYKDGKAAMKNILNTTKEPINVVYAHNDDMALGAIEAIEEHGLVAGKDIIVISVDATQAALKAIIIGKLNCAVECNPLLGPQMMKAILDLASGKEVPIQIITEESVYTIDNARDNIGKRKY